MTKKLRNRRPPGDTRTKRPRTITARLVGAAGLLALLLVAGAAAARDSADSSDRSSAVPDMLVGPDILVSLDGNFAHGDLAIAAHPNDPLILLAAASTLGGPASTAARMTARTYASSDGGNTWDVSYFDQSRGPDPFVIFGNDGTAYFAAAGLPLHRSTQGGRAGSWNPQAGMTESAQPRFGIGMSAGAYRNRLYVASAGRSLQAVDPGRPMTFYRAEQLPVTGTGSLTPLVLADGTIFLPFVDTASTGTAIHTRVSFTLGTAGGRTFSAPMLIPLMANRGDPRAAMLSVQFAVDRKQHPDRLYMIWAQPGAGTTAVTDSQSRVFLSYSTNRGSTWTPARAVEPAVPTEAAQTLPAIAVTSDGIVGITWLESRGGLTHAYFTASVDGAANFLAARRISSQSWRPLATGNERVEVTSFLDASGAREIQGTSGSLQVPQGGRSALAAGADGTFHPVWPDARSGVYQVYTTAITVSIPQSPPLRAALVSADVSAGVELKVDLTRWDNSTNVMTFPIRLHNRSKRTIYPPLRVQLIATKAAKVVSVDGTAFQGTADYSHTLGDLRALRPNSVSRNVDWRMEYEGVQRVPEISVRITGMVARETRR